MGYNRYYLTIHNPLTGARRKATHTCEREEYVRRLVVLSPGEIISEIRPGGVVDQLWAAFIGRRAASGRMLDDFYSLLATYMSVVPNVGIALERAAPQVRSPCLANAICRFVDTQKAGKPAAEGFLQFKNALPESDLDALISGLSAGGLTDVIDRLVKQSAYNVAVARKVKKALIYPLIVLFVANIAISMILAKQLPAVAEGYSGFGVTPTGFTKFAFRLGTLFRGREWLAAFPPILMVLAFANFTKIFAYPAVQNFIFKIPRARGLIFKVAMSRSLGTYVLLRKSGVGLIPALDASARQTKIIAVRTFFTECRDSLLRGVPSFFQAAMAHGELLGPDGYQFITLLKAGEDSGSNTDIIERLALTYQRDAEDALDTLSTILEPALLFVGAGVVVLVMLISVVPMVELNTQILPPPPTASPVTPP